MAKYQVKNETVLLPYYPSPSTGAPLKASESKEENAAKDEYGRVRVGHFSLAKGKEFYAGSEGVGDDLFYTHDDSVVQKYLDFNAVEEVNGEEAEVQEVKEEEKPKPKATKSSKSADNKLEVEQD